MIYLVTTSSFPFGYAASKRVQLLAEGMNKYIKCKVIVCKRIVPKSLLDKNTQTTGVFNGVEYEYTTKRIAANSNIFFRLAEDFEDAISVRKYLKENLKKGDYVYVFMRDNFAERLITEITHKMGCVCTRELCELPYGTGNNTRYMRFQRHISLNYIIPKYDVICAISEELKNLAKKYCPTFTHLIKIPIIVKDPISTEELEQRIPTAINLFHAGSLTQQKDGILTILEALGSLKTKYNLTIPFTMTGEIENSPVASQMKNLIKKYNLTNIHFLGYISDAEVENNIIKSTFLILYKTQNLQNKYCFATKLGEYMKNGKVIITTPVGEQTNYLSDKQNCLMVKDGYVNELAECIKWVVNNRNELKSIELNARETSIGDFDYIKNAHEIIKTLRSII